jgi:hypothetical protein
MQFLIGFFIIVVILATPAFRNITLLLALLGLIGFFYIDRQASNDTSSAFNIDEIEEEIRKSRQMISRDQIEISNLKLNDGNISSLETEINTRSKLQPYLSAVVKNRSHLATLTSIGFSAKLYDCQNSESQCDQIGNLSTEICADVPPGQVRLMNSTCVYSWTNTMTNMPQLKGNLRIDYSIDYVEGRKVKGSD